MKYLVYTGGMGIDSPVVGVRYDSDKKELMVGGYKTSERVFWEMLKTYFEVDVDTVSIAAKFTKRNKLRFIVENVEVAIVLRGLNEMEKQGIAVQCAKSFGKLMR